MATVPLLLAGGGIPESVFSQNTQSVEQLLEWTLGEGEDSFPHTLDPAPSLERVKVATFGLKVLTPSIVTLVDFRPLPKRETLWVTSGVFHSPPLVRRGRGGRGPQQPLRSLFEHPIQIRYNVSSLLSNSVRACSMLVARSLPRALPHLASPYKGEG